jgi:hypothetical protein
VRYSCRCVKAVGRQWTQTTSLYKICFQLLGRSHDTTTDSKNSHSSTTVLYSLPDIITTGRTTRENNMKLSQFPIQTASLTARARSLEELGSYSLQQFAGRSANGQAISLANDAIWKSLLNVWPRSCYLLRAPACARAQYRRHRQQIKPPTPGSSTFLLHSHAHQTANKRPANIPVNATTYQ